VQEQEADGEDGAAAAETATSDEEA
jgi:hypothetical protein